jgi:hypothetical protein
VQRDAASHQYPETAKNPKRPRTVHDVCILVKRNSIEIASTVVFLAILVKIVWGELGLPAIPWRQFFQLK